MTHKPFQLVGTIGKYIEGCDDDAILKPNNLTTVP